MIFQQKEKKCWPPVHKTKEAWDTSNSVQNIDGEQSLFSYLQSKHQQTKTLFPQIDYNYLNFKKYNFCIGGIESALGPALN